MNTIKTSFLSLLCLGVLLSSCNNGGNATKEDKKVTEIMGAGATFPYPLYSKMFDEYNKQTAIKVNYQSIGSGGGIKQLQAKTVDFGASDAPMNDEELSKSAPIVHIPTCLGAVMVTYNLPGNPAIKLTPDVVADIFLAKIKKWNDARIKAVNPDVKLPDMSISVVHRSDGSGTTYVFSDYLSKVSPEWSKSPGKEKSLEWSANTIGAKGNEGVGGMVKQTPGSIGYVELAYVMQNKMSAAQIKNKAGNFVEGNLASISAAANVELPADMRVSLTDTEAPEGYPISSFTYVLVYNNQSYENRTEEKAKAVIALINWMIHDGQKLAEPLNYAPLPAAKVKAVEDILNKVNFNNNPLTSAK